MGISTLHLEAFMAVAHCGSFSQASNQLHITQSALSQRVLNLENELEATLFIRESRGVSLTELGHKLLQYGQAKSALEEEFLSLIKSQNRLELSGLIKIGAFSTVARSRVLPVLGIFSRKHTLVHTELIVRETRELPHILRTGQAHFVFNTTPMDQQGYINQKIGIEENVLIESSKKNVRSNTYIDHDEFDTTTLDFMKIQSKPIKKYKRTYFDEIYTIINAAEEGFGRAVVPIHLVKNNKQVKILKGYKSLKVPIYFSYFEQSYYTKVQLEIIKLFEKI